MIPPGGRGKSDNWFDTNEQGHGELAFTDADERLPWLESDEGEEPAAIDTGRLIGIALIMIVALCLVVGGVWYLSNRVSGDEEQADGSLIAAPDAPYKERPETPGGKTFAGTGDTSYAVGEGQTVEGRLATASPAPTSTPVETAAPQPAATATPKPKPTATEPTESSLPAGTAVQVGAYSTRADAEAGWATLMRRTELLNGVSHRVIRGRADIGTVYRLQAVGGDKAAARTLCTRLKDAGIACQVK